MGYDLEKTTTGSAHSVSSDQDAGDLRAERPSQGSSYQAFFNIVCVVAGTGGWIGVAILVLSMSMSIYTGILLVKCLYYNGHTRVASYQEVGAHAYGKWGLGAVWFFHTSVILGVPVMFFILSGTEISALTKDSVPGITKAAWIWICCCFVSIPFVLMKTLKEEAMRFPKSFNKVLAFAMLFCCLMYALVAIPGYLTYGPSAKSPILSSLPENASRKVATIMIIAHVLLAAPVLMTAFALEIERILSVTVERRGRFGERIWRTLIRLGIMGVVGGIACLVPFFDSFLSLLGAFGNCMLIYVMPIGFYWKLIGWRTMKWYELVWCGIVLVIGLLGCVIGSMDAIKALHRDFTQGRE
ncbi:hypothetical protein BGZ97_009646 [Linnemannia gamsii]|uniref:Amino acid transporter transmembrane domain-containing protein n=1 Tax=Linnemannia gamsii TaxID=64522 RepID=A0A9P6RJV6_9FUNG|nr:hypothetical protein BGZ97_009646 [Linnemannia gamsii]